MQIGQYEVLGEIARGGFGVVYRARDVHLSEVVAIKVLLDARDEDEVARFLREGDAAKRMSHPNLVRVRGMGRDQGHPYLVMDYVDGPTLASRLARDGALPLRECVRLVADLSRGLAAAHA
ncbi:MAG: protein kinase, partial [Planctomycetes bacterium]|nr:protein kinase [Planctomycetota bacterium]